MSSPGVAQPEYRKGLWDSLLDADMNVQYWTMQSDRYAVFDKWLKVVIAVAASGTVASWGLWAQYPWAWKVFSGIAALAAIASPFIFPSGDLKRMSELVPQWRGILLGYELLWEQDRTLAAPENWNKYESVKQNEIKIDETRLPKSEKLRRESYNRVCQKRGLK